MGWIMSQSQDELQRFAEQLMSRVRDRAIVACDQLAVGQIVGKDGERWRSLISAGDARKAVTELIPEIVDQTLFELLNAIDNGELLLAWRRADGSCVDFDDVGMGEMAGWLMGSPGWRHGYSSQRFFDPLSDLRLDIDPKPDPKSQ
jgi:hypothetical protein